MGSDPEWIPEVLKSRNPQVAREGNHINEQIASNLLYRVLVARWLTLQTFIAVAMEQYNGPVSDDLKYAWLLFQILPSLVIDGTHVLAAFTSQALEDASTQLLYKLLDGLGPENVLGSAFNGRFYYVLDEAQVAGTQYMGSFTDAKHTTARPVLRPIIRTWGRDTERWAVQFIVSGTGFSLELFEEVLGSGVGKDKAWRRVHEVGNFIEQPTQQRYISQYLPAAFLNSPSGTLLRNRTYDWLRGRYRFTARFLEELLIGSWDIDRPSSPHKLLNAYVHSLANYKLNDGCGDFANTERDVPELDLQTFAWNRLAVDRKLKRLLRSSLYRFVTRGEHPIFDDKVENLVEYGLGSFTGKGKEVTVAEPLALMGIFRYFKNSNLSLDSQIRDNMPVNQGSAFEEALLLSYTSLFRQGARLDEIFVFHGVTPNWACQKAFIVARDTRGTFHHFDIITSDPIVPYTGISSIAKEPEDVEAWIKDVPTGWCLPGTMMGPDLMAWLQLADGKMLLLLIRAKCCLSGNLASGTLKADVVANAIHALTPNRWYTMAPNKEDATESMLSAINQGPCFTGATYNVLRVVAAFPQLAKFSTCSKKVAAALQADCHPIATMRDDLLVESLARESKLTEILPSLITRHKRAREAGGWGDDDEVPTNKKQK